MNAHTRTTWQLGGRYRSVLMEQALVIIALSVLMAGCQRAATANRQPASTAESPKVLRVGVAESAPPLIFKRDGQTVGLEADFAHALGETLGREVELVSIWWPDLIFELRKGHIDVIMAGMSITPQRSERVAFCDPYMTVGQQALIRAADREKFPDGDSVRRCEGVIGVEAGSTGERFARAYLLLGRVEAYRSLDAAVTALEREQVNMIIHDAPMAQWAVRESDDGALAVVPGLLTEEHLAWAVRQEDEQLREQLNATLKQWRATGRLEERIRKWLPGHESVR